MSEQPPSAAMVKTREEGLGRGKEEEGGVHTRAADQRDGGVGERELADATATAQSSVEGHL